MKALRYLGSTAFVLGLFTVIFAGMPWAVIASTDPVVPGWLRLAVFCLIGGILLVLITVVIEQRKIKTFTEEPLPATPDNTVLLSNFDAVPGKEVKEILGLVQGHTVYAIWLGKDLSAIVRLILGGELTEYTEMMGNARTMATNRMIAQAAEMNADAVINVRYMTTSVVGSAAELLAYGTAVKLSG
ncbi:YbjQ family protein [bacterium]|nr:YbjQ family protein [bacterium]MBU1651199.1 YbjQ family protein [bacterium]MBU1881143.1 YbjQ family protein [bacterium]